AISAGNLPNVAQSLRARWPEVKIIIAGDNDFQDVNLTMPPGTAYAGHAAFRFTQKALTADLNGLTAQAKSLMKE
ncbi:hypothetical protein, partial [Citrobacter freundii]|uniref:hypothetical protein n=1 Tax=Citrobacter freundii TaxID=546 RepID=UPI000FE0E8DC